MQKPKILILLPSGGTMHHEFVMSLLGTTIRMIELGFEVETMTTCGLAHANARNELFKKACAEIKKDESIQYILHLDDDHSFEVDDPMKLMKIMEEYQLDSISATYFINGKPICPCALTALNHTEEGEPAMYRLLTEWNPKYLYEVDAVGFGMFLMKPNVYLKVQQEQGDYPFEFKRRGETVIGEDIIFCEHMKKAGFRVYMHTGIIIGHMKYYCLGEKSYKHMQAITDEEKAAEELKDGNETKDEEGTG